MATKSDEARIDIDGVIECRDAEGKLHRAGGPARSSRVAAKNGSATVAFIALTARL